MTKPLIRQNKNFMKFKTNIIQGHIATSQYENQQYTTKAVREGIDNMQG